MTTSSAPPTSPNAAPNSAPNSGRTFDDVPSFENIVSELVRRLRRLPTAARGFVPHEAPALSAEDTSHRTPAPAACAAGRRRDTGRAVTSYGDVYGCASSTWGEGGYVPAAVPESVAQSTRRAAADVPPRPRAAAERSVRMPFRLFDDP